MLEAAQVPNQQALVAYISKSMTSLGSKSITKVKIYGRKIGEDFPDWQQEFKIEEQINSPSLTTQAAVEVQSSIPSPELKQEKQSLQSAQVAQAEPQTQEAKKAEKPSLWGSLFGAVAGAAGAVSGAAVQAGGAFSGTVVGTAGAVGGATVEAGQAVVDTAVGVGGAITGAALQAPEGVGYRLALVSDSPQLQQLTKALRVDWLVKIIEQVDIVKAET